MKWCKLNNFLYLAVLLVTVVAGIGCTSSQPALKDVFKEDFLIGMALNDDVVSGKDPQAAAIVEKHCNTITPENVMKWQLIHPEPNKYDFAAADRFVAFGQRNKMFIVGHTLVWNKQIPNWAFQDSSGNQLTRDAMLARMKDHILTVVGRYKGKVKGWDVVNEAISDEGELVKTKWLEIIGEDFIAKAFEYAHEADAAAELYYNEFHNEYPAKRDSIVRLVKNLKAKGLRIDGVGLQGHWDMVDNPTRENLEAFINVMTELGVKVMITEMDIDVLPTTSYAQYKKADLNDVNLKAKLEKEFNPYVTGLPDQMQRKLADRYAEPFSIFLKHKDKIARVTFWGVYDGTSWLNDRPFKGRVTYPLLFDRNYQPKLAFDAIVKTIRNKE